MTNLIVPFLKSPLGDLGVKQIGKTKIRKNIFQMNKLLSDNTIKC